MLFLVVRINVGIDPKVSDMCEPWIIKDWWADKNAKAPAPYRADPVAKPNTEASQTKLINDSVIVFRVAIRDSQAQSFEIGRMLC